jgi:hypothetical protein
VQPADSTINSTAQITAINDAVLSTTSALTTTTGAQIHSVVIKNVHSTPISTAVLAAVPQRVVVLTADLGALFTPTVIANIGRADPSRTWTINPETRTIAVLTEDRTLIVLQAAS